MDIELLIKIDESILKRVCNSQSVPDMLGTDIVNALNAIKNGISLPKGHGSLKDLGDLEECKEIMNTIMGESKYAVRMDDIRNIPTIIEASSKTETEGRMRDATPEERESIDEYIKGISKPTGVDFNEVLEQEHYEDVISRQAVINAIANTCFWLSADNWEELTKCINSISPARQQPKTGHWIDSEDMGEVSDGYHTFNQLYRQRAVLFATIVNSNKDRAWKSFKHSDGKYCFDSNGEWFIVGVDTPEGSYTYHYSKEYWGMFKCKELERGKEWDGHTEEDVTRLLSLE